MNQAKLSANAAATAPPLSAARARHRNAVPRKVIVIMAVMSSWQPAQPAAHGALRGHEADGGGGGGEARERQP